MLALGLESPAHAWTAVAGGADIYAFLLGILGLAELARAAGVFEALAQRAGNLAAGSQPRLFALVFVAGVLVTALLSNDTTVIVLTPAVFAALDPLGLDPMPYLYACAFVANAASFVLPFSNPANLIVYAGGLPTAAVWLRTYGAPAAVALAATYVALRFALRRSLRTPVPPATVAATPGPATSTVSVALAISAGALVVAATLGWPVGMVALLLAIASLCAAAFRDPTIPRAVAGGAKWSIVPLVAGLFVVVDALDRSGALAAARELPLLAQGLGAPGGALALAFGSALASNVANNLPVALAARYALHGAPPASLHAALVGIDLGPNLSLTGSLATLLWLVMLRREGREVGALTFLRLGAIVALPALAASALALLI